MKNKNSNTVINPDYFLLQVNDPTFPIGSFSHTYGFETYVTKNIVTNAEETYDYVVKNLRESFLYTELLAVKLAYEYMAEGEIEQLVDLDRLIRAIKAPYEIRDAGEKLGIRFLKNINNMDVGIDETDFVKYVELSEAQGVPMGYSTIFGAVCGALGIDKEKAMRTYLYNNTSGLITNAVKIVPLSQTSGQQIMVKLYPVFEELMNKVRQLDIDSLGRSNPGFEIRSMQHENLYTRIYIS